MLISDLIPILVIALFLLLIFQAIDFPYYLLVLFTALIVAWVLLGLTRTSPMSGGSRGVVMLRESIGGSTPKCKCYCNAYYPGNPKCQCYCSGLPNASLSMPTSGLTIKRVSENVLESQGVRVLTSDMKTSIKQFPLTSISKIIFYDQNDREVHTYIPNLNNLTYPVNASIMKVRIYDNLNQIIEYVVPNTNVTVLALDSIDPDNHITNIFTDVTYGASIGQ